MPNEGTKSKCDLNTKLHTRTLVTYAMINPAIVCLNRVCAHTHNTVCLAPLLPSFTCWLHVCTVTNGVMRGRTETSRENQCTTIFINWNKLLDLRTSQRLARDVILNELFKAFVAFLSFAWDYLGIFFFRQSKKGWNLDIDENFNKFKGAHSLSRGKNCADNSISSSRKDSKKIPGAPS